MLASSRLNKTLPSAWPEAGRTSIRPKKRLGQHFLVNRGVLQRLLAAAELTSKDVVIEVGPGLGVLTRELVQRAGSVIAVELDRVLAERLKAELGAHPRLHVICNDILTLPPQELLALLPEQNLPGAPMQCPYKVVANLPYYITAPVLRHFLESPCPPTRMVVMVQYEVAKSITAQPGQMSLLSSAVQFYGRPHLIARVAPGSFSPPPKVASAIVGIDCYPSPPVAVPSPEAFFDAVRAGFSAPRKQLHNSLAQGWRSSPAQATAVLTVAGVGPERRAQTLALADWARIAWARQAALSVP